MVPQLGQLLPHLGEAGADLLPSSAVEGGKASVARLARYRGRLPEFCQDGLQIPRSR